MGSYEDASSWFSTAVEHVVLECGVWGVHEWRVDTWLRKFP